MKPGIDILLLELVIMKTTGSRAVLFSARDTHLYSRFFSYNLVFHRLKEPTFQLFHSHKEICVESKEGGNPFRV